MPATWDFCVIYFDGESENMIQKHFPCETCRRHLRLPQRYYLYNNIQLSKHKGKVKLRFNRLTSQNCKSIKRDFQKIILELSKRSIV